MMVKTNELTEGMMITVSGNPLDFSFLKLTEIEKLKYEFFYVLATNSLPTESLIRAYEVRNTGVGDFCVTSDRGVHFIRGNTAISLRALDQSLDLMNIAAIIDKRIVRIAE